MSYALTILNQIIVMFLLAGIGFLLFRTGKIGMEGSRTLGNILIYLSLPCVTINNLAVERTPEKVKALILSFIFALIISAIAIVAGMLACRGSAIEAFATAFSNAGFFGVPIIAASLAPGSVFYIAPYMIFLNLFQWTHGVALLRRSDGNSMLVKGGGDGPKTPLRQQAKQILKKFVTAPIVIGMAIGLFFFISGLHMPLILDRCVDFLADLNTPLAMFTVGVYLAQTDPGKMFRRPGNYRVGLMRMIVVPLLSVAVLSLLPAAYFDMKLVLLIACLLSSACGAMLAGRQRRQLRRNRRARRY